MDPYDAARRDPGRVVLEGVHALKHAVRFGGVIERVCSPDPAAAAHLLAELAPDVAVPVEVEAVTPETWQARTRGGLPSPVLAVARRPTSDAAGVLGRHGAGPVVLLDAPRHLGNIGACVRVAAASSADALVVLDGGDPWHPTAVRGGAGLQFALPVGRVATLPHSPRPLVALAPDGAPLADVALPHGAILAFGSERRGLSAALLERAELQVAIPMRPGVSSLNLATSVAVALYAARWEPPRS